MERNNNINSHGGDEKPDGFDRVPDKVVGLDFSLDESLTALLASTFIASEPDDINDIEEIAGEYSVLNNTIDELNSYLDRWDQRHDMLRARIKEVLKENQETDTSSDTGNRNSGTKCEHESNSGSSENCSCNTLSDNISDHPPK